MHTGRRRLFLVIAAVSIAGLLLMHGGDPVMATVDGAHTTHSSDTGPSMTDHGALGLCVFVAAVAGLGLAWISRGPASATNGSRIHQPKSLARTFLVAASGPSLLHRLCVLRR